MTLLLLLLFSTIQFQRRQEANPSYEAKQATFLQIMKWTTANIYL